MKKTLSLSIFFVLSLAFLFWGNSSGSGQVQMLDFTGSPLSPGSCNTSGCHDDEAFEISLEATLLDGTDTVTAYEPGKEYTFRFTIDPESNDPTGYGFQAVALTGDDNLQAGAWGGLPEGIQVTTIDNRDYVEHSEPSSENTFDLPWTAPASETGPIRFYAAGNAVNRDFSSNGDGGKTLGEPLTIMPLSSSIAGMEKLPVQLSAFPNPVVDLLQLDIEGAETGLYQLSLIDLQGRLITQRTVQLMEGAQRETLNFASLPDGHYLIRLSDGRRIASLKVVKG